MLPWVELKYLPSVQLFNHLDSERNATGKLKGCREVSIRTSAGRARGGLCKRTGPDGSPGEILIVQSMDHTGTGVAGDGHGRALGVFLSCFPGPGRVGSRNILPLFLVHHMTPRSVQTFLLSRYISRDLCLSMKTRKPFLSYAN